LTHESREHRYYEKFKNKLSPMKMMKRIREGKAGCVMQIRFALGLNG